MALDVLGKLKEAKDSLAGLGLEKTQEVLGEINLLLTLLKDAGYEVNQLEIEVGVPPKVTINLMTGSGVSDEKLNAIFRENQDKKVLAAIVASLLQANKLRGSVEVETLELKDVKIVLTASPSITMQWKEKSVSRP